MNNIALIDKLIGLIEPIVHEKEYELYHVEFVKENGENYLRIYIDKEDGISFKDCEDVSRTVSDMLDAEDPIADPYYLEVSSPGIERTLYCDKHLEKYIGFIVLAKLTSLINGKKQLEGKLICFDESELVIEVDEINISIPRNKIKVINLKGDF